MVIIKIKNNGHSNSEKNFLIQYSFFESGANDWYLNSVFDECCDEGLYEIKVNFSTETNKNIYVCYLYPDFESKHYTGQVYTRSGFNGWNWFSL